MPLPFLTPVGQWGHLLSCFCLFQAVPCCFMRPMGRIPWTRAVPHDVPSLLRTALCSLSQNIPRRKTCSASATPLEMSTFSRYCCAVRGGSKERHGVNEKEWKWQSLEMIKSEYCVSFWIRIWSGGMNFCCCYAVGPRPVSSLVQWTRLKFPGLCPADTHKSPNKIHKDPALD